MFNKSLKLPKPILFIFILTVFGSLFLLNTLYTIEIVLTIYIVYKLTWRKNEPPIVFMGIIMQLLQVIAIVILSNIKNEEIETFTDFPYYINSAFNLSIIGIILISLAFNIMVNKLPIKTAQNELDITIKQYNPNKIIFWYFIIALTVPFLISITYYFGSASQIIYKFLELKWAIFLLFYFVTVNNNKIFYLILIIVLDITLGLTSFFSNYKEVILAFALTYFTYNYRLSFQRYILVLFLGVVLFLFASIWQYAKNDYRQFLSGETSQQAVVVSKKEALTQFVSILKDFDYEKIMIGSEQTMNRTSYINYFSAAMDYVPHHKPFQNGKLTTESVFRAFMPRIFFPNKEIVDDSKRTVEYTGVIVKGGDTGTSISMGYFSEFYVDFGKFKMLIVIFIFGLLIGYLYRIIYTISYNSLWFYAYLVPFIFCVNSFEVSLNKIIPSMIFYLIIILIFNKFLVKHIDSYFRK